MHRNSMGRLAVGCALLAATAACAQQDEARQTEQTATPEQPGALVDVISERYRDDIALPTFKADAAWPSLPDGQIIGQTPGLAVDGEDNVWILHRPNSLNPTEIGASMDPPIAVCCAPAPHVIQFSPTGEVLRAWGGPDLAPTIDGTNQWPDNVHGLFIDDSNTVWLGGNGDGDHVVLNFTADGSFIRQIGRRGATEGNFDKTTLGNPADISREGDSVLVADGYINKRIIGFSAESGDFQRFWGAYGTPPDAPTREGDFDQSQATSNTDGGANPDSEMFGDIVHCVVRGPDNTIYVCDRRNNRVQVFAEAEDGSIEFVENVVIRPETGGTRTASDVAFSPDGKFVYVADMMNGRVWILLRENHEIVGSFGRNGRYPGQFIWLHSVETDSQGNVYTTEVNTGRRVQKFVFTGMEGPASP